MFGQQSMCRITWVSNGQLCSSLMTSQLISVEPSSATLLHGTAQFLESRTHNVFGSGCNQPEQNHGRDDVSTAVIVTPTETP